MSWSLESYTSIGTNSERTDENTPYRQCLLATRMFSEAVTRDQKEIFFRDMITDSYLLTRSYLLIHTLNVGGDCPFDGVTGLDINFFKNRIVTRYKGEEKSVSLSCVFDIMNRLSEIFSRTHTSTDKENLRAIGIALKAEEDSPSQDLKYMIGDGKTAIELNPSIKTIVLSTDQEQSSIPLEVFQNCALLFHRPFIENICPLFGIESDVVSFQKALHNLYLGRCIVGVGKSMATQHCSRESIEEEISRISSLIIKPGSAPYTSPLI